ncbi:hypothetical protein CR513_27476, partial [Mucuna pruriens]
MASKGTIYSNEVMTATLYRLVEVLKRKAPQPDDGNLKIFQEVLRDVLLENSKCVKFKNRMRPRIKDVIRHQEI